MKLKKQAKILLGSIAAIAVILAVICVSVFGRQEKTVTDHVADEKDTVVASEYVNVENGMSPEKVLELHDEFEKDHEINQDLKGILCFNSELIHQPVFQGEDNNTYLRTNWEDMSYLSWGSVFIDSYNDPILDDENIVVYGHYVYPDVTEDRTKVFTPLDLLKDPAEYEKNRYLAFVMENEVRYYEVSRLFQCPLEMIDGIPYPVIDLQYNLSNYDPEYFTQYMNALLPYQYYETGAQEIRHDEYMMTLQTCIENDDSSREIILCREIGHNSIESIRSELNK